MRKNTKLRLLAPFILVGALLAQAPVADAPITAQPIANMKELMVDLIFPTSNAIFYVREGPTNGKEWDELVLNALTMAEAGNLLMQDIRARDKDRWMKDAKLLLDCGRKAYRAAKAKDVPAILALNDELYEACQSCHEHYRPGYRRRP